MSENFYDDVDPIETNDWMQSIESVIKKDGIKRARFLIEKVLQQSKINKSNFFKCFFTSNYVNTINDEDEVEVKGTDLGKAVSGTINHITQVYDSLPRCTALVVYSGTGDPREIRRLQTMQQQYRREYATKNWDNLSVKWTDTEVQALSQACQDARNGVGFIVVK